MNLIYQLQCTECNAFYIGETCHSLSDRMNGHRSPPWYRTQTYQLSSTHNPTRIQECWSVSVIHKLPDSTQTTSATNLKLHTNLSSNPDTFPSQHLLTPPNYTLAPVALTVSTQSPVFYCWGRPLWSGPKSTFSFHFISICLSDAHPRAGRCSRLS